MIMLIDSFRGVCIEKREKVFEDGSRGWFTTWIMEDGNMVNCWLPGNGNVDGAHELEAVDVEGYREDFSRRVRASKRLWNDKTKRSIIEISM